jgi:hypothetical protein
LVEWTEEEFPGLHFAWQMENEANYRSFKMPHEYFAAYDVLRHEFPSDLPLVASDGYRPTQMWPGVIADMHSIVGNRHTGTDQLAEQLDAEVRQLKNRYGEVWCTEWGTSGGRRNPYWNSNTAEGARRDNVCIRAIYDAGCPVVCRWENGAAGDAPVNGDWEMGLKYDNREWAMPTLQGLVQSQIPKKTRFQVFQATPAFYTPPAG